MPWESKGGGSGGGPWGSDGNGGGGTGGTGGGTGGNGTGGPKSPWGPTPPPKPPSGGSGPGGGNKGSGNTPDFDEFIRKSQERLRNSFNGGGTGGGVHTAVPWSYIVTGLIALWIAFTSTYRVGPQERGVVQRFGRYVETTGPGLHFKLPTPIDGVTNLPVEAITSTNIGAEPGQENLILTGDQNIINMAYTVRWKISDPVKYMFELYDPPNTVKEVAESAMRSEVGRVPLNAAIGGQRAQIADEVRGRMQELLTAYKSGIEVVGVDIRQADPPEQVDEAFKQVTVSQQKAQSLQNDARAYAQQQINQAQGATAKFDALYAQYKLAPEVTRRRLYYETMEEILGESATTVIEPHGVTPYLPVPPARKTDTIVVTGAPKGGVK